MLFLNYLTVFNLFQLVLFVLAVGSFLIVARQDKYSIYGYWLGLLSQPIWAYISYSAELYGVLAMAPFYAYGNWLGIQKFHEK